MGMLVSVYRNVELPVDCSNGGISARHSKLCVVNVEGPFEPDDETPAVLLEPHYPGILRLVPAVKNDQGRWVVPRVWHMFGGNYGSTSDSRFTERCEALLGHKFYGAVAIHDRVED